MASGKSTILIVISIAIVIIWIIAGVFITQANVKLPAKTDDDTLHSAYKLSFWAAFTTWTLVGIGLILIILGALLGTVLFSFGIGEVDVAEMAAAGAVIDKTKEPHTSSIAIILLFLSATVATITGVMSAITAYYINDYLSNGGQANGGATVDDLEKARKDAVIASILTISSVAVLVISVIVLLTYQHKQKIKFQQMQKQAQAQQKIDLQAKRDYTEKLVSDIYAK